MFGYTKKLNDSDHGFINTGINKRMCTSIYVPV